MGIESLKRYLDAREALAEGDRETAGHAIEEALGSAPNNPVLRDNVGALLDHKGLAGEAVLEVIRVEMQRSQEDV